MMLRVRNINEEPYLIGTKKVVSTYTHILRSKRDRFEKEGT